MGEVLVSTATGLLGPVMAWQGRRVRQAMPPMTPAEGARFGVALSNAAVAQVTDKDVPVGTAVLLVGESTVAGCGAPTQGQALGGQLGAALAGQLGHAVKWHAVGRIGVTAQRAAGELEPAVRDAAATTPFDVVVIALGGNDTLRRRSTKAYTAALAGVVAMVRRHTGAVPVVLVRVPPVGWFPALPQPLRAMLGLRARLLDHAAARWAARTPSVVHAPAPMDRRTVATLMAADGFHPSPAGYARLAAVLAPACAKLLSTSSVKGGCRIHPPKGDVRYSPGALQDRDHEDQRRPT
jgi:lysophospholipase L1-like esterase